MKAIIYQIKVRPTILIGLFVILALSCSKDVEPIGNELEKGVSGVEADSINNFLAKLSYDPDQILNVQSGTGTNEINNQLESDVDKGSVFECRKIDYNIRTNFQDVVMFDPTIGVIYPGALVIGNREMLDGAPQPLQISKAPAKLRIELPGIGENGNITVVNPTYQNTQASIDEALEYWNAEVAPQGYEIDSDAYFEKTTAYSKEQMSLELGVSAEWAGGSSFESQFEYTKTTEKRVATLLYRQVFYDVIMETPESPASVFGADVDLQKVQSVMSNDKPPAYVSSVQYGRIIMMRMETTDVETDVNLEAVLDYATAKKGATVEIDADYEKVIKESTINVITIGGNAEVASRVISGLDVEEGKGGLNYVISEGSLYSRDNPGAPIGYTVKYLKDNRVAKMGYNTDYRIERCKTFDYVHKNARLKKTIIADVRFRFSYKKKGTETTAESGWKKVDKQNIFFNMTPVNGAHDVKIQFQYWDLGWKTLGEQSLGYLNNEVCYEAYCSKTFLGICTEYTFKGVNCN